MIVANPILVFGLLMTGLSMLWKRTATQPPSTPPLVVLGVWDSWWPWLGLQLLSSVVFFVAYMMMTKRVWDQVQLKASPPEGRREGEASGTGDISKSPSISLNLTMEEILYNLRFYTDKFKSNGIAIIDHEVLDYTGEVLGYGRYSQVYAVRRAWPGHHKNVPLCVKLITNKKPSAIILTCIEVLNVVHLLGIPGVPRVVAVCLTPPPLIVMTQHSRTTLNVLLQKCSVSDLFLLEACHQLCVTLDHIHRRKRIHNDVKGNNICVDVRAGNHPKVTLIDYGLMTREGEILFDAPISEMDRMKKVVEHRRQYPWYDLDLYMGGPASPQTDIYSVAVLLRQVLRVMCEPPAALQACVREGLGKPSQRPPLTRFKAVLQAYITALNDNRQ